MSSGKQDVPTAVAPALNLGNTLGVVLLSVVISAVFYGITVLQSLYYFDKFSKDSWKLKVMVSILWVFDTMTLVLETHALYYYLIINYANPGALIYQTWSLDLESAFAYSVMFIAQMFFITRINTVSGGRWFFPLAIGLVALAAYAMGLATTGEVFSYKLWSSSELPLVKSIVTSNKVLETVTDTLITAVLCWTLYSRKTGLVRTDSLIKRLIMFALNRGAIAAVIQIAYLISFLVWPSALIWGAFHISLSKIYSNSVLAILNSRTAFRGMATETDGNTIRLSTFHAKRPTPNQESSGVDTMQHAQETIQHPDFAHTTNSAVLKSIHVAQDEESILHVKVGEESSL